MMEKLNATTWKHIQKDDWRERLEVVIGDDKQPDFKPQIKILKWSNECNASFRLVDDEKVLPIIKKVGKKLKYIKNKKELHFYNIEPNKELREGGYEFEVILKEKPSTNKLEFTIKTKGLKFYYQPPMTEEKLEEGQTADETHIYDKDGNVIAERPENVVGSYAVYHESKSGDYSKMGGKNYRAGKAFHIYRPRIEDANGNWTWGKLNIDEKKGILTIEIDQNFLDKAVYPVKVDPTFGYDTLGGSRQIIAHWTDDSCRRIGNGEWTGASGTIDSIHVGLYASDTTQYVDVSVFLNKEDTVDNSHDNVVTIERADLQIAHSNNWYLFEASSESISEEDYILSVLGNGADITGNYYNICVCFDNAETRNYYYESINNGYTTLRDEDPWTAGPSSSDDKLSIYCTYTAGGGDVTVTPAVQTITSSQQSPTISTQKNVSISTATQTLATTLLTITLSLGTEIGVNAQTGTVSQQSPTITTQKNVSVSADVQTLALSQLSATVSISDTVDKVVLVSPDNNSSGDTQVYFVWQIPSFTTGRNIHFQIQIDKTDNTFNDIEVSKDSREDSGFEYWDGSQWQSFGSEGVSDSYIGNNARIQINLPSQGDKYWRVRGYS